MRQIFTFSALCLLLGTACPKSQTAEQVDEKKADEVEATAAPTTALEAIQQAHDSLTKDCGKEYPELKELEKLELAEADQAKADALLQEIGSMAQSCASDFEMPAVPEGGCNPDCSWCPVKWYWCIYNGGACAGGDNKSCCKLGACGSKHHCKEVCESSCGCDVPPLPADGGGDGDEG